MASVRPVVILTTKPGSGYSEDQHVFLRPTGSFEQDPAVPYGIYSPATPEYKVLRDGSRTTGVRLGVRTQS